MTKVGREFSGLRKIRVVGHQFEENLLQGRKEKEEAVDRREEKED